MLDIGLIGNGAIGSVVAEHLEKTGIAGLRLAGVLDTFMPHKSKAVSDINGLMESSSLIVEMAGHAALMEYAETVLKAPRDLFILSVGALSDKNLHQKIFATANDPSCGNVFFSTGAIGGLDILRAARKLGLTNVKITSRKPALNLIRPWMSEELQSNLKTASQTEAFSGTAAEAAEKFPESANVCASLALATLGFEEVQAVVIGEKDRVRVQHLIEASGPAGNYELKIENEVSPDNSKTSALVPYAVLRALEDIAKPAFL